MCHDLDPRSYRQGHSVHIPKTGVLTISGNSPLPCWIWVILFITQLLTMTHGCVMTLNQGHISKVRSVCTHTQNPCPGHNSSLPCWIWIIFHTIVIHHPRVYHYRDPRSYLQCPGHRAYILQNGVWALTPHCHVGS